MPHYDYAIKKKNRLSLRETPFVVYVHAQKPRPIFASSYIFHGLVAAYISYSLIEKRFKRNFYCKEN